MRVILSYNATPTNPCGSFLYGQVEDYTLNLVDTLGVSDSAASGTVLYPNPVKDLINIQSKTSGEFTYKVYNAAGQLILNGKTSDKKINASKLSVGNYIMELQDKAGNKLTQKFIKQ